MAHKLTDEQIAALNSVPPEEFRKLARVRAALVERNPLDDMPKAIPTHIAYIVWNAARTEGYITFDQQVAYEARKGAESNCFDANGTQMKLAQAFCEIYSGHEDATKQIVVISEPPEYPGD
jgi:hypothetical protein